MNERSLINHLVTTMPQETPTRGQRTRNAIIRAAHRLFVKQGYHGTSMRQIAKQADIALGGIYNHFAGKENIFHAVFLEYHPYHEVLPALEAAQGESVEEFVRDAASQMLNALKRRPDFLNLMFIEIVEFESVHVHELFANIMPRGVKIVQSILSKEGQIRPIPPVMIMRNFIGLFFSYHITEVILGPEAPPEFQENAMQHAVDIYLYGILSRD
jgi:AcrR family transcriptional regulator